MVGLQCLKYDNYFILNNEYTWEEGNLYDKSMGMKIFTLSMNEDVDVSFKNYEESGYNVESDLLTISSFISMEVTI